MSDRVFGPSDIVGATADTEYAVSLFDLRNWVRDNRFNTSLTEPRAGYPRAFPLNAAYEAPLIKIFVNAGVSLEKAKRWNGDIIRAIIGRGVPILAPDGSQRGGGIELVGFNPGFDKVVIHEGLFGETAVRAFYSIRNKGGSDGRFPALISLIHLPAVLSNMDHKLGVTR